MVEAYVGLGSNLGDKVGNLKAAVAALRKHDRITAVDTSVLYRTAPVGILDQDWFVNTAVRVRTTLGCRQLLEVCLEIEESLKRVRRERWGPRTIDLDVLVYGEESIEEQGLEVPHPRMMDRAFVLAPLADLNADLMVSGKSVLEWLESLGSEGVERLLPMEDSETVAILGASRKEDRYSNKAQRMLMEHGHSVVPVAPVAEEVLGVRCLKSITACKGNIDTVTLYVGPQRLGPLVDEIIEKMPRRVIFNPGTESEEYERRMQEAGIEVEEACTLVMLRTGSF
ncbi:MAG: 2-amino-4-hydroxy-6-hydroxymethyldihydropteridine diphosphokinase [Verrucomicrobiota bacterium]